MFIFDEKKPYLDKSNLDKFEMDRKNLNIREQFWIIKK